MCFFWSLLYGVCGFRAHQIYWNFSGCLLDCAFTFGLTNVLLDRHKLLLCLQYCLFAQIQATNYFPCKKTHRQRNGYSLIVNPDKQGWEIHSLICPSRQIKKCHCFVLFFTNQNCYFHASLYPRLLFHGLHHHDHQGHDHLHDPSQH